MQVMSVFFYMAASLVCECKGKEALDWAHCQNIFCAEYQQTRGRARAAKFIYQNYAKMVLGKSLR